MELRSQPIQHDPSPPPPDLQSPERVRLTRAGADAKADAMAHAEEVAVLRHKLEDTIKQHADQMGVVRFACTYACFLPVTRPYCRPTIIAPR